MELAGDDGFKFAPEKTANAFQFQEICEQVFERMRFESKVEAKVDLLLPFLGKLKNESGFPLMRLILPELDNVRDKYGVKTAKLAKLIAQMYFPDKGARYTQLVLHTDPVNNPSPEKEWQITGDFPLTLQYVLERAPNLEVVKKTAWTLKEVNETLDDLARASNDAKREEVLRRIRVNCSPMNQKWIARIILKNLKIKLKKDSVLRRVHPDALDEYSRTTSLKRVCSAFIGRHSSVRTTSSIEVFTSFSPMLATNFFYKMDRIVPSMSGRPFCMDVKLDGERMLCHRDGKKIKWFTRNAKDYSGKYGAVLDPHVFDCVSAQKCILDGEVVTWDDTAKSMVPFGHNRTYAREEMEGPGECTRWLFYVVFDIIYAAGHGREDEQRMDDVVRDAADKSRAPCAPGIRVQGGNLTAMSLDVRRRVLRAVLTEREHRLEFVKSREVEVGEEHERKRQLFDFFDLNAIRLGEEGLVVKNLERPYQVGDRSRQSGYWVKMKPEYSDQTADVDVLILGAGFAQGAQRSGLLSKFLVGVAVPTADGSPPTTYYPITRVGTGFTVEQLEDLNERLRSKWKTFDEDPEHFDVKGLAAKLLSGRDGVKISRWIAPEDSLCLEIKSMEIVTSSDWPLQCTLRFPRVTRIRYDKGFEGCIDTTQVAELQAAPRHRTSPSRGKLLNPRGYAGGSGRKRSRGKRDGARAERLTVSPLFATGGGDRVPIKRRVFVTHGKSLGMCVVGSRFLRHPPDDDDGIDVDAWWGPTAMASKRRCTEGNVDFLSKKDMGDLIRENGGTPTPHPNVSTAYVVVGGNSVQVQNVIKDGSFNVVDYRWVLECVDRGAYDFPPMQYLRAISPDLRSMLSSAKDIHGDDYREPIDVGTLSQLLLNIQETPATPRSDVSTWLSPIADMDPEDRAALIDGPDFIFSDTSRCLIYCDQYQDLGSIKAPDASGRIGVDLERVRHVSVPFNTLGSTAAAIRLHGGEVAASLHVGVTHVVLDPSDTFRHAMIRERVRDLHCRPESVFNLRLVTREWVWRCVELGRLEPPLDDHFVRLSCSRGRRAYNDVVRP